MTFRELCETYLKTIQHQKPKTIERKSYIVKRIKTDWPGGVDVQLAKIRPSEVQLWLSRHQFGPVSRNLHLACVNEIFSMAVAASIIPYSPAANFKAAKLAKPIRKTPTFEEFKSKKASAPQRRAIRQSTKRKPTAYHETRNGSQDLRCARRMTSAFGLRDRCFEYNRRPM